MYPHDKSRYKVLSIELEPTHYKTDLWNVVAASGLIDIYAIYTQAKNWSADGGHNYLRFPKAEYEHEVLTGCGMRGKLRSALRVTKSIITNKSDAVLICSYSQIPMVFAIFTCLILRKHFLLYVDQFNNGLPPGKFKILKWGVRELLRKLCFRYAIAILVCGRM